MNRGSTVGIETWATGWMTGDRSPAESMMRFLLIVTASIPAPWPTQPPMQWIWGRVFPSGLKRPDREADHSHLFSAEVKNAWGCISTPPYVFIAWYLDKPRDNFLFTLRLPYNIRSWYGVISTSKYIGECLAKGLQLRDMYHAWRKWEKYTKF